MCIIISCYLESCESIISFTDVSVEDFNEIQRLIAEYQVTISNSNCDEGSSVNILSAMEQYFANALKSTANSLR